MLVLPVLIALAQVAAAPVTDEWKRGKARERHAAGQEALSTERFEQAAAEFKAAIALFAEFAEAHYGLGQASMALKRYDDAVHAFTGARTAIEKLGTLGQKERDDYERQIDYEIREVRDALKELERVSRGAPNRMIELRFEERLRFLEQAKNRSADKVFRVPPELSLSLGSAQFRAGHLEDAEREWRAAADADQKLGSAQNNLAVLYMMTGRFTEAEERLKLAEKAGFAVNPQFKTDLRKRKEEAERR